MHPNVLATRTSGRIFLLPACRSMYGYVSKAVMVLWPSYVTILLALSLWTNGAILLDGMFYVPPGRGPLYDSYTAHASYLVKFSACLRILHSLRSVSDFLAGK